MEIKRYIKQVRKQSVFLAGGLRLTALYGRFVGPKVLVNSVPKAGTNLLQELVTLLPLMRGKVTKTFSLMNGVDELVYKLNGLQKGECAPGHVLYDARIEQAIKENDIRHILIVRDFRDVVYSNIRYIETIHVTHPHNKVFSKLSTLDEKIQACLLGNPDVQMIALPYFISQYREWVTCGNALVVRYENLLSLDRNIAEQEIRKIIKYLGIDADVDVAKVRAKMFNPNGLTFNSPGVDKWRKNFTQEQIALLNSSLGEELSYFGYKV